MIFNQELSRFDKRFIEKSTPDISLLPLIADTFKCSLDELFSREAPKSEQKDNKDAVTAFFPELGEMLSEAAKKAEADKASKSGFADIITNSHRR